jgi:invasion protein IalB
MLKLIVITISSLALAAPAIAQTAPTDPAAPSSTQPKLKDQNRMICEKQEEIGSRLGGKKVCHTAAEWQELRRQNKEQIDDWQQRLTANPKPQ